MNNLSEKNENFDSDDYEKVIQETIDKEINERKPPNEKILHYKLVKKDN